MERISTHKETLPFQYDIEIAVMSSESLRSTSVCLHKTEPVRIR